MDAGGDRHPRGHGRHELDRDVVQSGYAGRTATRNRAFLSAYNNLKGDVLALETGLSTRDKKSSSIRLSTGFIKPVPVTLGRRDALNGHPLTQENLEAIRASLDATLSRRTPSSIATWCC